MKECRNCSFNVEKKCREPIFLHKIPSKNCENVAVNLFGSMPLSKHIVIVYNLVSMFPAGKLFTFKMYTKVIQALNEKFIITLGTHKCRYPTMGHHSAALNWTNSSHKEE